MIFCTYYIDKILLESALAIRYIYSYKDQSSRHINSFESFKFCYFNSESSILRAIPQITGTRVRTTSRVSRIRTKPVWVDTPMDPNHKMGR